MVETKIHHKDQSNANWGQSLLAATKLLRVYIKNILSYPIIISTPYLAYYNNSQVAPPIPERPQTSVDALAAQGASLTKKKRTKKKSTLVSSAYSCTEEERNVFHGRADLFIARMHLVQGDRRFSPWNGSVVDSVVGVFLTQNVSDLLSSSAFMSLAAPFILKSSSNHKVYHEESISLMINKPQVHIVEPEECTK
ncbi:hypothetical protein RIF29_24623 [Crotalaria pallida]|uniref:Uncharacterized protein n=1 Tax=Crotalaria pallida TaxID=3830 RepID=A0AAN9HZ31_CROPI